jgi:hypothetical protein
MICMINRDIEFKCLMSSSKTNCSDNLSFISGGNNFLSHFIYGRTLD